MFTQIIKYLSSKFFLKNVLKNRKKLRHSRKSFIKGVVYLLCYNLREKEGDFCDIREVGISEFQTFFNPGWGCREEGGRKIVIFCHEWRLNSIFHTFKIIF